MSQQVSSSAHILIIEEQPLALSYMKQSLERLGYRSLHFAENAIVAKELCKDQRFDLIICAFNLSKHQDGYQLYEELKVKKLIKGATGFIFISAETSGALVHSVLELHPDDFLVKPFNTLELQSRIERIVKRKHALKDVYQLIDDENYSKALKVIDAKLVANQGYAAVLLRLKGETLLLQKQFEQGKSFFKSVLDIQKFTWARIGMVEALIGNNEHNLAHRMLKTMLERDETRLVAYDLLSQLEIKLNQYEQAQAYLSAATTMAPRNLARQTNLSQVAQINHDYEQNYQTCRDIAKFAPHSIHDSPDVYLNAARAGIDYALTTDQSEHITRVTRQTTKYLNDLKKQFPDAQQQIQVDVLNARLYYLKDEHHKAKMLLEQLVIDDSPIRSIDGALDQAKAYHELGFHAQAQTLYNKIIDHCERYPERRSPLQLKTAMQQQSERRDLTMGPRELNNHAVEKFKQGNYLLALEAFSQAFRVMPKNRSIALNLLQCLYEGSVRQGTSFNQLLADKCCALLDNSKLDEEMSTRYEKIKQKYLHAHPAAL
ncbi:response regulator [Pseudoalteromonas sp. BDTF-M6]|uniref:response regulator n=1 Tax=Pseudoalteromonas sp. BDTF-M6 TaxID=2796132 RepID=UPI001BAF4AC4|nr:response regulator [Pseudoalteromonas sp. BDTF-M6]MBS3798958.1 response regulator [Pseudoalteromonas sp. BDTF-M6]